MRLNPDPVLRLVGFIMMVTGVVLIAVGLTELVMP